MLLFGIDVDISSKKACLFIAENQSVIVPVQYSSVEDALTPWQIDMAGLQLNGWEKQMLQLLTSTHETSSFYLKNILQKERLIMQLGIFL